MRRIVLAALLLCPLWAGCGDSALVYQTQPTPPPSIPSEGTTDPQGEGVLIPDVLPPDPSTIIQTGAWGDVYDRRIVVRLVDGTDPSSSAEAAAAIGGSVVERIDEYLIAEIELATSG